MAGCLWDRATIARAIPNFTYFEFEDPPYTDYLDEVRSARGRNRSEPEPASPSVKFAPTERLSMAPITIFSCGGLVISSAAAGGVTIAAPGFSGGYSNLQAQAIASAVSFCMATASAQSSAQLIADLSISPNPAFLSSTLAPYAPIPQDPGVTFEILDSNPLFVLVMTVLQSYQLANQLSVYVATFQ
jgi:hypothetical protein